MPKTAETIRRSREAFADLQRTNESQQRSMDHKRETAINDELTGAFSHQFRDGPGGRGLRMRKTWAMRAPWQKTIINGQVVDE